MTRTSAILLLALGACYPAPSTLSLPDPGEAKTAIFIVSGEGRTPSVFVSDFSSSQRVPEIARLSGSTVNLDVVYYACSAELLRIPLGVAPLVPDGHPIPAGKAAFHSTITDDGQSAWTTIDHPPLAKSLKIAREIRCAKFDLTTITLVGTDMGFGVWAIPIAEDEVLVAVPPLGFWRVTPTSYEEVPEMMHLPNFAFYREREDRVWLYGANNELAVGDPRTGVFERMPGLQDPREPNIRAWMAGAPEGSPFELYTFHDRNVIARFDGTTWTKLFQGPLPLDRRGQEEFAFYGGLAWLGPSNVLAVWDHFAKAKHVTSSTVSDEPVLPDNSGDHYSLAANVPGLGPVAGTKAGRIFVRSEDGTWIDYPDAPISANVPIEFRGFLANIVSAAPLDDGLLVSGALGEFTQLQPELMRKDKYCHYDKASEIAVEDLVPESSFAHSLVPHIQPLGCGYVFVSRTAVFDGDVEIGFLKRK